MPLQQRHSLMKSHAQMYKQLSRPQQGHYESRAENHRNFLERGPRTEAPDRAPSISTQRVVLVEASPAPTSRPLIS